VTRRAFSGTRQLNVAVRGIELGYLIIVSSEAPEAYVAVLDVASSFKNGEPSKVHYEAVRQRMEALRGWKGPWTE
jgi:hypothetical protein